MHCTLSVPDGQLEIRLCNESPYLGPGAVPRHTKSTANACRMGPVHTPRHTLCIYTTSFAVSDAPRALVTPPVYDHYPEVSVSALGR